MKTNKKENRDNMYKRVYGKVPKDKNEMMKMVEERITSLSKNTPTKRETE